MHWVDKVVLAIMTILATVLIYHLIAPTAWRWLDEDQITSIGRTMFGLMIATTLAELFVRKRNR